MPLDFDYDLSCLRVDDSYRCVSRLFFVVANGHNARAVRAERKFPKGLELLGVQESEWGGAWIHVPHLGRVIVAGCDDLLAVGTELSR